MEPGELVVGRYRIRSLIGRGAMGVVWLARDERLDRDVAVKQLVVDGAQGGRTVDEATRRAVREGQIAARLRHPNAIAVHDVVPHHGKPCLVMEYVRAQDLGELATVRGGLPPAEAARIGAQVASALAAAHAAGIVHRDIKPENVLITADGDAKLTDFGISHAVGMATVTATGILAGTPAYLAPETAGGAPADPRSDVFSLGATLYAAIEGLPPFGVDDNPLALLHLVAGGAINPPRRAGKLTDLLLWLLRRAPEERPTMAVAQEALAEAARGKQVAVPAPRTPTLFLPGSAPARRLPRRALVAGITAAGLVAAGVVVGVLINNSGESDASGTPPNSTTPPPAAPCTAIYDVVNTWPDGYSGQVMVRNDTEHTINGWVLRWTLPDGHDISNLWGGVLTKEGNKVTVTNADWNVTINPGEAAEVGFNAAATNAERPELEVTCQER